MIGRRGELVYTEETAYWEEPVARQTSFVAAPWLQYSGDLEDGWRGEAVLGLKRVTRTTERSVSAVQAAAVWISHPPRGCGEGGGEIRWLHGQSLGASGFANVEIAARTLSGGCGSGRIDLTAGYRAGENWLAMAQVFAESEGIGGEGIQGQLSFVKFERDGGGLQFGLRTRFNGGERETALVVGFWGRPGD